MNFVGIPKRTELNVKDYLIEELRKTKLKIETELSYPSLSGRQQPDALLEDGGKYYLEVELGEHKKILEGLLQSYEYLRVLKGRGAFTVLLPEKLRKPLPKEVFLELLYKEEINSIAIFSEDDIRTPQRFRGNLVQTCQWIYEHVEKPKEVAFEPDVDLTIRILRDAVEYLSYELVSVNKEQIEEVFGGRNVFENILEVEEQRFPLKELKKAATYLLVNQIFFYHFLHSNFPEKYEELKEEGIIEPSQLIQYFAVVLKDDYSPVFSFHIADKLPKKSIEILRKVISAIKILKPQKIQTDLLGKIFHDLIPLEARKYVAAFYTNNEAAELMATLTIDKPDSKIMDLACGSGTLLVAGYHRKKELIEQHRKFTFKDHQNFLENDITGVDIMPFAAHLAVVHLSLQGKLYPTEKVRVAVWDSTQLIPDTIIPSITKELKESEKQMKLHIFSLQSRLNFKESSYIKKGVVSADKIGGEEIKLTQVDSILINPPFTRQERLPEKYKQKLDNLFSKYSKYSHGQLGLHGYFIFLADIFLKKNGTIGFVLPASVLRVRSTQGVRQLLVNNYHIKYIITAWEKLAFSEAAWFRDIILVAQKLDGKDNTDELTTEIVTLKKVPKSRNESLELASEIKAEKEFRKGIYESDNLIIRQITKKNLQKHVENLFYYISVYDPKLQLLFEDFLETNKDSLITLEKYLNLRNTNMLRGIETRSTNSVTVQSAYIIKEEPSRKRAGYFWTVKSENNSTVDAENVISKEVVKIPKKSLVMGLRSFSGRPTIDVGEDMDYVVTEYVDKFFDSVKKDKRKQAFEWGQYVKERKASLFINRRFVLPAQGTVHLAYTSSEPIVAPATLWCIPKLSTVENKIQALWLNSSFNLIQLLLNKIQDVWVAIHEYSLNEYLVINPDKLTEQQKKEIESLYDEIKNKEFPSLIDQFKFQFKLRKSIDSLFLKILNYNREETKEMLTEIYKLLIKEFEALDKLM